MHSWSNSSQAFEIDDYVSDLQCNTFFLIDDMRLRMSSMSGSGAFDDVAQIDWFGQPSQALALPASAEAVPGQCSGASAGVLLIELTTIISSIISHLVWLPRSEGHACTACRRHLHHACLRRRTHAFITSSPSRLKQTFVRTSHKSSLFWFVFLPSVFIDR